MFFFKATFSQHSIKTTNHSLIFAISLQSFSINLCFWQIDNCFITAKLMCAPKQQTSRKLPFTPKAGFTNEWISNRQWQFSHCSAFGQLQHDIPILNISAAFLQALRHNAKSLLSGVASSQHIEKQKKKQTTLHSGNFLFLHFTITWMTHFFFSH